MFGIIRHHEHNFHLYSERKALLALFTLSASFAAQKLSYIDHATIFFSPEISVTDSQTSATKSFFFLSPYCDIHENLVPQEVTQGSLHRIQRTRIISSVTQDGVRVLVVNCLSFRNCQTLNYHVCTRNVSTYH